MSYQLSPLPYSFDALEPYIDAQTMEIHHDKHHATYLNNLNKTLESVPALAGKTAEDLLKDLTAVPESVRTSVRNNGGGFVNHNFFWLSMAPKVGGELPASSGLGKAILASFGSFDGFKEKFAAAALGRFGSGWAWLALDKSSQLTVYSTANQDSPLSEGFTPLLGLDVWEHAYYLKYQNRRADYIGAWWNLVNWEKVIERFSSVK
ncbi:MAG: superoxide dismutase [Anaerolineaceae bacterium]